MSEKIIKLGTVVVALLIAYRQYETLTACPIVLPSQLTTYQAPSNFGQIMPSLAQMMRNSVNAQLNMATEMSLAAYQGIATIVLRQPPDIYGWTFLILIAIPFVEIVVLVSRNLDGFAEAVFHAAAPKPSRVAGNAEAAPSASQCNSCGERITADDKFCSNCGTASSRAKSSASAGKACPSCSADNPAGAKFCTECGNALFPEIAASEV